MKIMSVDFGDSRTGLAVCDSSERLCSPLGVIGEKSLVKTVDKIVAAARENAAAMIVVGLPRNMDGSEGVRAEKSREFKAMLERDSGLPVVLWDERRSSIEAHAILHAAGKKEKQHRKTVDAVAASLILEGYLGSLK